MIRTFLALTCCLALTAAVRGEEEPDKNHTTDPTLAKTVKTKPVKTQVHSGQFKTNTDTLPAVQSNTHVQSTNSSVPVDPSVSNTAKFKKQKNWTTSNFKPVGTGDTAVQSDIKIGNKSQFKKQNWSNQNSVQTNTDVNVEKSSQWKGKNWSKQGGNGNFQGQVNANKSWKIQKFSSLHKSSGIPRAQFSINARINGSDKWQGQQYNAFRIYSSQRHDRGWWSNHHNRIVLVGGGYYYWDNGYWYPAWGYDPDNEFYAYDGPIYGYNDLPPDQVIANVQAALQEQGYYQGEVDGLLGPLTRAALAGYQRDHGLYTTSAIDEPTLESLGMS